MENNLIPEQNNSLMSGRGLMLLGLSVVMVILVVLVYGYWHMSKNTKNDQLSSQDSESLRNFGLNDQSLKSDDLSGLVLISAITNAGVNKSLQTYSYDLSSAKELTNESEQFGAISTSFVEFKNQTEPGKFFFKSLSELSDGSIVNALYRVDSYSSINRISEESEQQAGVVSWSEKNSLLASMVLRSDVQVSERSKVESWNISLVKDSGEVVHTIEHAANPVWLEGSGKLFYVKPDGLYFYEVESGTEVGVMALNTIGGNVLTSTMFDISSNGLFLVMTMQGSGGVGVYTLNRDTGDLATLGLMNIESQFFTWPVISPDNLSYAVIAYDKKGTGLSNPRLEIRPVNGRAAIVSKPLKGFVSEKIFIDDWIAKPVSF